MSQLVLRRLLCAMSAAAVLCAADPAIIAHRGGAALRPENTLAAFRHSVSLGVPVLEFDMNLTADDGIILHHDSSVNPGICQTTRSVPIRSLKLQELRRLDCGSFARKDSPRFRSAPGERMPTLDEFLEAIKSSNVLLLGETKMPADDTVPPEQFARLIDATIRKHGVADRFILQSSDYRTTEAMRKLNPKVRICLLNTRRYKPAYLAIAQKYGATHLMLRHDDATPEQVRALKAAGLVLYSGTSNRPEEWPRYVALGFHGILTDDPVSLGEFLSDPQQ